MFKNSHFEVKRKRNIKIAFVLLSFIFLLVVASAERKELGFISKKLMVFDNNVTNLTISVYNSTWLEFDGNDGVIVEDMNWNFNNTNSKTISVWFNAENKTTSQGIVSFGNSSRAIDFYINGRGIGTIQYRNKKGSTAYSTLNFNYNYGNWSNLIIVWNGSTYDSFLNGENKYTGKLDLYPVFENNMAVGSFIGNNFYLNGGVDEAIIMDKAINGLEVKDIYYSSRNGFYGYSINKTPLSRFYEPIYLQNSSNIYGFSSKKLYKSIDGGHSFQLLFDFSDTGVATSREFWRSKAGNYYLGLDKTGKIAVSIGNDKNWTYVEPFVCKKDSEGISTLWFIDEDSLGNLYIGEYGGNGNTNCAFIHKSIDKGLTWKIVYNSSSYGWGAEHIHIVAVDPKNDYIYATQGDGISKARLIRSADYGETWTTLQKGVGEAQYISIVFGDDYRLLGTDNSPAQIIRTYDDINFETAYTVPKRYEAYFWKMGKDKNTGYVYAGTVTTAAGNKTYLLVSPDNGDSWFTADANLESANNHRGYRDISEFGEDGCAYLSDSSNGFVSYKFNLLPVKQRDDLIGRWKLDENSETVAYDSSGNNNHGTIYGASWKNDGIMRRLKKGTDYKFDEETKELVPSERYLYTWFNVTYDSSQISNESKTEFERLEDMPEGLDQHSMEACDGYLWVVGGRSIKDHSNRTYRYSPSTNEWARMKDVPYNAQSAVLRCYNDKKLYYIGGHNSETREIFNYNYEYDIDSGSWTKKSDMLYGVEDMGSVIYEDAIYLFGGLQTIEPTASAPKNFTQMYNITSNSWGYKADISDKKWSGDFSVEVDGLVYLIGSTNTFKNYPNLTQVPTVYVYDIAKNSYSQVSNITLGVCYKEAEELDGLIYVFGGSTDTQDTGTDYVQVYKISSDIWEVNDIRLPYSARGIAMAKLGKTIYMSGGAANKGYTKYNEFYKIDFNLNNDEGPPINDTINDTTPPVITSTSPTSGFATGIFEVRFIEENPKKLNLIYGNGTDLIGENIELEPCVEDGEETICSIKGNLSEFDGQKITYYFRLEDIAGNYDESQRVRVDVDVFPPILNNLEYRVSFRMVSFTFNVSEPNFDRIKYTDIRNGVVESSSILCWRLENGICSRTKWIRSGNHVFKIEILDKAGHNNSFELEAWTR